MIAAIHDFMEQPGKEDILPSDEGWKPLFPAGSLSVSAAAPAAKTPDFLTVSLTASAIVVRMNAPIWRLPCAPNGSVGAAGEEENYV